MTKALSPIRLAQLSNALSARLGLYFPPERWRDLERALTAVAADLSCPDAAACIDQLVASPPSREQTEILARHLTVGETYFFREPQSFAALQERILPDLIRVRRGRDQRLRLWSAGCATGEEAYSLAIILTTLLPDVADWNITILATDINPRALQTAAEGVYTAWSFRATATSSQKRYFIKKDDGRFAIAPNIRQLVTFAYHNLAEDNCPSLWNNTNAMDVILCRNVLMYFAPELVTGVLRKLYQALIDGGWLIVSPTEAALVSAADFVAVNLPGAVVYRKESTRQVDVQRPAALPVETGLADATTLWRPALGAVAESAGEPPRPPGPAVVAVAEPSAAPSPPMPLVGAEALYHQGRYAEAAAGLTELVLRGQAPAAARGLLVRAYANQGKLADALACCDQALAIDPLNVKLQYLRATVLQEQGATAEAMRTLRRTLYLEPRFVLAHFALGNLALRANRSQEAAKHFAHALALADQYRPDDLLPESEGLTAGRLTEIIRSTTGREIRHENRCDAR
jgi:chemotaxis protein methyltransferase CheR